MPDFTAPALPADVAQPTGFLQTLLTMSLTAVAVLQPLYAENGATIRDFAWVQLNPAGQQLLGQPERPTASLLTLFPAARQDGVFDLYCQAFRTGELQRHQTAAQHDNLDGYFRLVAQRYENVLIVNFTDTNEQSRLAVEGALRESRAREQAARAEAERGWAQLQALLTQAPVAIALLQGEDLHVVSANDLITELWGYTPAHVVGRPLLEGVPELQGQGFDDLMRDVMRTQVPFVGKETAAVMLRHGQLQTSYFDFVYHPQYDAGGQVQGVIIVATDMTDQVRSRRQVEHLNAELAAINEELRATNDEYLTANTALGETQQQLRQLNAELEARVAERTQQVQTGAERERNELQRTFAQAPVAIFVLHGPAHILTLVNPAMQEMLGLPAPQLLGKSYFEAMPELADQGYADFLTQAWRTGQPYVAQEQPATLRRHEPGESGYFTFVYHPLQDVQGQVTDIMCVAVDVTAQVRARQRVQDLNEELAALNEELTTTNEELHKSNTQLLRTNADLDTFVYAASHDLKAPITNIEGLLDALREFLPTEAQEPMVPRLVGMMEGAISRFQQTVGHLTDVSRLQATPEQGAEELALARVLDDVRLDLLPLLESTRTQLLVDVAAYPRVVLPAKNLRSILYNLVSNAVKYRAPDRAPLVQVRARPAAAGGMVLEVQDNGLGLSEVQQTKLFTMFRRLHTHVEGSGVGLYMIKRLAENAGGTITVQSQPGVGSTFTVTLPRA